MTKLRYGTPQEAGLDPARIALARERCAQWVTDGHTPSLVVLAARNGVIALHEAFGQRTPAGEPLARDAVYTVLSVSKPITAALALVLVEDGRLGLNRPVRSYLPELSGEGTDTLLVAHLLSHTSGYSDLAVEEHAATVAAKGPFEAGDPPAGCDPFLHRYLAARWAAPLSRKPGEQGEYCNHGYEVLGEVVRRAGGGDLEALARERLFGPLGMADSCYRFRDELRARLVERPSDAPMAAGGPLGLPKEGDPAHPWSWGFNSEIFRAAPSAAGGVCSTAYDLAIFLQTMLDRGSYDGRRALSPASVEAMTRNQITGIGTEYPPGVWHRDSSIGYSWLIESSEKWPWAHGSLVSPGTFHHQGFGGAFVWADPDTRVLGVWLGITMEASPFLEQFWNADLYQNMISASVAP